MSKKFSTVDHQKRALGAFLRYQLSKDPLAMQQFFGDIDRSHLFQYLQTELPESFVTRDKISQSPEERTASNYLGDAQK